MKERIKTADRYPARTALPFAAAVAVWAAIVMMGLAAGAP